MTTPTPNRPYDYQLPAPSLSPQPVARKPRVGGWGWAIFFFGWLGGLIGYFSLKDKDPRRASHVAKWGLIWTAIWIAVWIAFYAIMAAVIVSEANDFDNDFGFGNTAYDSAYEAWLDIPAGQDLCPEWREVGQNGGHVNEGLIRAVYPGQDLFAVRQVLAENC